MNGGEQTHRRPGALKSKDGALRCVCMCKLVWASRLPLLRSPEWWSPAFPVSEENPSCLTPEARNLRCSPPSLLQLDLAPPAQYRVISHMERQEGL